MRVSPRARARMQRRNATNAAARLRGQVADARGHIPALDHMVRLHVKAVGASEPVGKPVMPQNKLHDGVELRRTHRANGGLSKGIVEATLQANPLATSTPSYVAPGDPQGIIRPRFAQDGI